MAGNGTAHPFVLGIRTFLAYLASAFGLVTIVRSESDLENQDDDYIYGDARLYYIVDKVITSKEFIGDNSRILGCNSAINNLWTYTGTGVAFQNLGTSKMRLTEMSIDASSGTMLKINGDNTSNINQRLNLNNVVGFCDRFIEFDGAGALVLDTCNINCVGTNLYPINVNATGIIVFNIDGLYIGGTPAGGAQINFNSSTANEWEINNMIYDGDAAGYAISGLPNCGNVTTGGRIAVTNCNFNDSNNPLNGIQTTDVCSFFEACAGLDPSQISAVAFLTSTYRITVAAAGIYYKVMLDSSRLGGKFELSGGGLKYIGDVPVFLNGSMGASADKVGGGRDNVSFKLGVYDDSTATTVFYNDTESEFNDGNTNTLSMPVGTIRVERDDILFVYGANLSDSIDIDFIKCNLSVHS